MIIYKATNSVGNMSRWHGEKCRR